VSRSASFVIAYMMREKALSFDEAYSFVQKARPCVFPNQGFVKQL
jgi:protein-tyrosine phosphatase